MPLCLLTVCCMFAGQATAEPNPAAADEADVVAEQAAARPLVEIATQQQAEAAQAVAQSAYLLGVLQQTRVSIDFVRTSASDAFEAIGVAFDFPFIVHYRTETEPAGIDPLLLIDLNARGVSALTAIEMMLDQCSTGEACTWQFLDGTLEVGSKSILNRPAAQSVRTYYVRDLLLEPPYFSSPGAGGARKPNGEVRALVPQAEPEKEPGQKMPSTPDATANPPKLGVWRSVLGPAAGKSRKVPFDLAQTLRYHIADTIDPTAWDVNGGTAASIIWRGDAFLVRAPDHIHRRIAGLPEPMSPQEIVQIRTLRDSAASE